MDQGKADDALALLNNAIAAGGTATAYALRCGVYDKLQKYETAKPDCAKALQLDPNLPVAHENQGDLLYDSGNYQGSLKEYDRYLALKSDDAGGYWRRCDARRRIGDWTGAQSDCEKAYAGLPDDPFVRISHGRIELRNKQFENAYQDFDMAVTRLPGNTVALYWRGYSALQLKRYDQAVADFTAGIKAGDEAPDTYFNRSRAYMELGRKDLAKSDWEIGIALERKYGLCDDANANAVLETVLFGGNQVTAVICK